MEIQSVRSYFDQRAASYLTDSSRPLWKWQRAREMRAVIALMGSVNGNRLLDIGCGVGQYTRAFLFEGASHVTALDLSAEMVARLPDRNVEGIVGDAESATFDGSFPAIVCAGLLEFADAPAAVLTNARRHIDPDGRMVCLVPPNNLAGRLYRRFHARHGFTIKLYSDNDFTKLAESTGWRIAARQTVWPYAVVYRLEIGETQ